MDGGYTYLLVVLCLVILSVSMLRRSQNRSASVREAAREQYARLRDQSRMRETMEELLLQLEEVSRRVNAQVDTRFSKLEHTIRDADERIAKLEKLRSEVGAGVSAAPGTGRDQKPQVPPARHPAPRAVPGRDTKARDADQPSQPTAQPPDGGRSSAEEFELGIPGVTAPTGTPGQATSGADASPSKGGGAEAPSSGRASARRQRIYEMADAGTAAITIADTLSIPLGEVELILNLRKYRA